MLANRQESLISHRFYQKVVYLKEILEFTNYEHRAIEENKVSMLNEIIRKKQNLMRKIDRLDKQSQVDSCEGLAGQAGNQLTNLEKQARGILSQLAALEKKNEALLREKMQSSKEELDSLQNHRKVRQVYKPYKPMPRTDLVAS